MCSKCKNISHRVVGIAFLVSLIISSGIVCHVAFADDGARYRAALQLVDLTYDAQSTYESSKSIALLALKDRFENNPKTKDYGAVLTNVVMEVMDAYFHDVHTQDAIRMAFAKIYADELTEHELKKLITFYETPLGKKALQKLPMLMQKCWQAGSEIGSQISSSPKYKQLLIEKIETLKDRGLLPQDF